MTPDRVTRPKRLVTTINRRAGTGAKEVTNGPDGNREFFRHFQPRFYAADRLAQDIVRGIDRNAAVVIAPASARVAWYLWRLAPFAVNRMTARHVARTRESRGLVAASAVPALIRATRKHPLFDTFTPPQFCPSKASRAEPLRVRRTTGPF
jgi:hypothetical protein